MKIMSFNTQHCKNYITQQIDFDLFAKTIIESNADIVGLNEIRDKCDAPEYDAAAQILGEKTGMYYYFGEAIKFDGFKPYGNAILSRYPFKKVETVIIPDPEPKKYKGYYETRCLIKAEFENGLTVLVTHFGLNIDEQENAVKTVLENIPEKNAVLMGDFNMRPDNPILKPIKDILYDTAEKFDCEKFSFVSTAPDRKIDYIFTTKDVKVIDADIPQIVVSDHFPHTATIEL